jgi:hypothetical protein
VVAEEVGPKINMSTAPETSSQILVGEKFVVECIALAWRLHTWVVKVVHTQVTSSDY